MSALLSPVSLLEQASPHDEAASDEHDLLEAEAELEDEKSPRQRFSHNFNKLRKRLERQTAEAITEFNMIEDGDTVMVCLSGGKDSYSLLDILMNLQSRAPVSFKLIAMNLDQKQPGFPAEILPNYLKNLGVPFLIAEQDTYSTVKAKIPEGKTMCSLCSRLRRGVIYRVAKELGATKIALGHHRDDILETFFLNMFFGGRLKAMPPKLQSDDGEHIITRPLAYCEERDLARYARAKDFPIIPCNLCGSQPNLQRKHIKAMLQDWQRQDPRRLDNIFRSLKHLTPSHLLDAMHFDFFQLSMSDIEGDRATEEGLGF
ncbi:MAG: tRNA 2-thiocytidine(32) synthetase TtcA [Deinococcales bacterium]